MLGIKVARTILTGDVAEARRIASGRKTWSVPEARAITGACRVAAQKWGADVSFSQFI